jgi:hypothetical protein
MLHIPDVGGDGQSALLEHDLVQICVIMISWHEL